ncbi:conserved hypothetical protein [Pediculus humanus corporis]|uniref:Uncharacterized protein n=1 Tax=Pediculus humanus subsp. corporis TaxID=121224 RepID=E0VA59_PEDHC|nr:uncharacterized protein Phum_PHUM027600 [Pediculus humanus corporis]EEB10265.1 conserved hypothetical protein [Pediculus humanus corporis]
MPPRSGMSVSTPINNNNNNNPPDMILPPNSVPVPSAPTSLPNSSHSYSVQEPHVQNYISAEHQHVNNYQEKKMATDSQYSPYNMPGNLMQMPPNYSMNYPPQNYSPNGQNYGNQLGRDYSPSDPTNFVAHNTYRYPNPSYMKPDPPNYPDYSSPPQQQDEGYPRGNVPLPLPAIPQDSYVLTQLTDSSKSSYPVQSFPLGESSFERSDYQEQMYSDDNNKEFSKIPMENLQGGNDGKGQDNADGGDSGGGGNNDRNVSQIMITTTTTIDKQRESDQQIENGDGFADRVNE